MNVKSLFNVFTFYTLIEKILGSYTYTELCSSYRYDEWEILLSIFPFAKTEMAAGSFLRSSHFLNHVIPFVHWEIARFDNGREKCTSVQQLFTIAWFDSVRWDLYHTYPPYHTTSATIPCMLPYKIEMIVTLTWIFHKILQFHLLEK